EVCARSIAAAGGEPGHFLHNAYGYGLFTGGLGLHFGAEALGVGVIPAGGGQSLRQIRLLEDLKPQGISCTPSYALTLVDVMEKEGVDPRGLGTRYGIFGAEPWSEAMRRAIEEAWGLKAVDIYGLSEIIGPGVGCECVEAQAGPHINEDHFLVEVVDPETGELLGEGEVGELVFTTLTKEAMPLLRYRTGDLAAVEPPGCACGRTFRRISRIKGRTDDMIILRGVNVFPSEVERVILSFSELAPHYRLVLRREDRLDELEVQVEATPRVWDPKVPPLGLQQKIAHRLHEDLGVRLAVVVLPPGSLPRSEGKALRVVDAREEKG
ncbi:MAG: phenylacetate--CoA ligase, partial [Bacillota bacterium]|nr:phenylacetate--CoA ligase [Bacillota bacterium]